MYLSPLEFLMDDREGILCPFYEEESSDSDEEELLFGYLFLTVTNIMVSRRSRLLNESVPLSRTWWRETVPQFSDEQFRRRFRLSKYNLLYRNLFIIFY